MGPRSRFDYDRLLSELEDLGAERVEDRYNGDFVQVPYGDGVAITITPGTGREKVYLVEWTSWDRTGASSAKDISETDELEAAVERVRQALSEEEARARKEDASWREYDHG